MEGIKKKHHLRGRGADSAGYGPDSHNADAVEALGAAAVQDVPDGTKVGSERACTQAADPGAEYRKKRMRQRITI